MLYHDGDFREWPDLPEREDFADGIGSCLVESETCSRWDGMSVVVVLVDVPVDVLVDVLVDGVCLFGDGDGLGHAYLRINCPCDLCLRKNEGVLAQVLGD